MKLANQRPSLTSLKLTNLSIKVAEKIVVSDLSLEIFEKNLLVLLGPNGSGKSSLLYTLAGHPDYHLQTGKILLNIGKKQIDLTDLTPDQRARHGLFLAFQTPIEVAGVKVFSFLWAIFKLRFADSPLTSREKKMIGDIAQFREYLIEIFNQLGLAENFLERGLNEGFSGGEKKRLEMAQMLLLKPKFAFLDETDSGLDIDAIKLMAKTINRLLRDHHTAILLVTHYQRITNYLKPDQVRLMINGHLHQRTDLSLLTEIEQRGYQHLIN